MTELKSAAKALSWVAIICAAFWSVTPAYAQVGGSAAGPFTEDRVLDLPTNDLVYDPFRQRIYVSVPSTAGIERGNTITTIDPRAGVIESSVFIGSEPGQLAISDDGQYLYVGLDGDAAIRRFDIPSQTPGLQFSLGSDWAGPLIAEDIDVVPGNPHAVAVSRMYFDPYISPRHHSVVLYNNGVARPNIIDYPDSYSQRIEFDETGDLLFGVGSSDLLQKFSMTQDGLTELATVRRTDHPFGRNIIYLNDRIYASTGVIIDPDTLTITDWLGVAPMIPLIPGYHDGLLALVPHQKRIYLLMSGRGPQQANMPTYDLHAFHMGSLKRVESRQLFDGSMLDFWPIGNLIAWGNGGLAFRTNTDQIYLLPELPFTSDDVILDFGPAVGLSKWMNDSDWVPLHSQSPDGMITGDLDNNGQSDVLLDFGPGSATWKWMNDDTWVPLLRQSPEVIVTGDLEGNSKGARPLDLPVPIPDNDSAGVESIVKVDVDVTLEDVDVRVVIEHSWVGDLRLVLRSPAGTETFLLNLPGNRACPDDNMDVTFDDDIVNFGNVSWHCPHTDPWYRGLANPDEFFGSLAVFDGESSLGEWTLIATDFEAGDIGSIIDWELITTPSVGAIASGDDLILGSPALGTLKWMNDNTWARIHSLSPEAMVTGDLDGDGRDDVVADFGSSGGIWKWMNDSAWIQLHNRSPEAMVTGDLDGDGRDDLVADFGSSGGAWKWMNDSVWIQLHYLSPEAMVTGDLDGDGRDDLVADFGSSGGAWKWMNDSTWIQLHHLSPEAMVTGDLDRNGQEDVVLGLGAAGGTWKWMNDSTWIQLHHLSPEAMVTGNFDGN